MGIIDRRLWGWRGLDRQGRSRILTRLLLAILLIGGGLTMIILPEDNNLARLYRDLPAINFFLGLRVWSIIMSIFGLALLLYHPRHVRELVALTFPFLLVCIHLLAGFFFGRSSLFAAWFFGLIYLMLLTMYYGFTESTEE
jgi:hypothetical protein